MNLTKEVKNLHTEKYKTLMKIIGAEIEHVFFTEKTILKFFIEKNNSKIHMKSKNTLYSQTILSKKNKA